jgi:L-histidine N-alpha-methyltransferase
MSEPTNRYRAETAAVRTRSYLDAKPRSDIGEDARRGLTSTPKYIPCKYFYDAYGSKLFEDICRLPEYYLTDVEMSILRDIAPRVMEASAHSDLVELGSGGDRKIRIMLDAAGEGNRATMRYIPVDISEAAIAEAARGLLRSYPELEVLGIVADLTRQLDVLPDGRPKLLCFLGSTIGNFGERDGVALLRGISGIIQPGDRLLVGFDMIKPREVIEAAYNDSQDITAEFNRNVLRVLNSELDADFDPDSFDHLAFFNEEQQRVEMHLQARRDHSVRLDSIGVEASFRRGETIHTESSRKYTQSGIEKMARRAGMSIRNWHTDDRRWFSVLELVPDHH